MADAPERIWAWRRADRPDCGEWQAKAHAAETEYVRADIAASQLAEKQKQLDELPSKALWDESRKALASMRNEVGELKRQLAEALEKLAAQEAVKADWRDECQRQRQDRNTAEAERDRLAADNARLLVLLKHPINMQDVRLAVGEGKLSVTDILVGVNAELSRRTALAGKE